MIPIHELTIIIWCSCVANKKAVALGITNRARTNITPTAFMLATVVSAINTIKLKLIIFML